MSRKMGFTLLELLVVILIIGMFAAFAAVRLDGAVSGGDLRLASRMIIGEIRALRGKAAHTHRTQQLTFDIDKQYFYPVLEEVEKEETAFGDIEKDDKETDSRRKLPEGVFFEDVAILSKDKIQNGEATILFFPDGTIERSLIHLRNEKDGVYTLEINPLTGAVKIHDRYIEQKAEDSRI
jgi:prepilin-type N-terminal cleavage/methylation domain-containing protein